ncbi:MAG: hypothetical protein HQL77_17840 [Magnetococcales bacterium]|nr:hypothetical protein [Magnetococcales bacterium]
MNQLSSHTAAESTSVSALLPKMDDLITRMAGFPATHARQTTNIEQNRVIADVQSAVIIAQNFPRNERHAMGRIVAACNRMSLAKEAFFSFHHGEKTITGASIKLARELARTWGNIRYEIVELSRNISRSESEVMAYAWDLETNTRSSVHFIVPHKRFTMDGEKTLTDPQDINELIANFGARFLRQCIFAVIPADVITVAERVCRKTLQNGDGLSLNERIKKCVEAFHNIGVSRSMLSHRLGFVPEKMTLDNLTDLQIVFQSIKFGEPISEFFSESQQVPGDHGLGSRVAGSAEIIAQSSELPDHMRSQPEEPVEKPSAIIRDEDIF